MNCLCLRCRVKTILKLGKCKGLKLEVAIAFPSTRQLRSHGWLVCFSFLHLWFYFGVIMIKHVLMYLLRFALWHISSNCSERFFRMGAHFSVDSPTPRAPNHGSSCARFVSRNGETKGWTYHGDGEVDGRQRETRCAMCCARFCPVSRRRRHPFDWIHWWMELGTVQRMSESEGYVYHERYHTTPENNYQAIRIIATMWCFLYHTYIIYKVNVYYKALWSDLLAISSDSAWSRDVVAEFSRPRKGTIDTTQSWDWVNLHDSGPVQQYKLFGQVNFNLKMISLIWQCVIIIPKISSRELIPNCVKCSSLY